MIVIEEINRCTFMDALQPQKPAPITNARQIIKLREDGRCIEIHPAEELRLRRLEQKVYRSA